MGPARQASARPFFLRDEVPVTTPYVRIEWAQAMLAGDLGEKGANKSVLKRAAELAGSACKQLGSALLVGNGLWGSGLFDKFGCYLEGKKISGDALNTKDGPRWTLTLYPDGDELRLALTFAPNAAYGDKQITAGEVTVKKSAWTQDLLRDRSYARLLAAAVLDTLPAMVRFKRTGADALRVPIGDKRSPNADAPKAITVFGWYYSQASKTWAPKVRGSGERVAGKKSRWQIKLEQVADKAETYVYGQRATGPGHHVGELTKELAVREQTLLSDPTNSGYAKIRDGVERAVRFVLLDTVAAGFVGARYGTELQSQASAILPTAAMIGLVLELRGGPAAGLRLYYDEVPKKAAVLADDHIWLAWSRLVAGYAFNIPVPYIIDRVVLTPKLGMWRVDSRLPTVENEELVFRNYNTGKALSLGLDVAVEVESAQALGRLWHSQDIASPLTKVSGTRYQVLSSRTGVDLLIKGPPLSFIGKDWYLSFLMFGFYEDLEFKATREHEANFTLINDTAFIGGGVTLSW